MSIETEAQKTVQDTERTLLDYCSRQGLFRRGDRVIAACSGGADSVALLLFLLRCQADLGIRVAAAHVDHGIRGDAGHADAAFVADLCRARHVPLYLFDAERQGIRVPPHPSEGWARELRYGWFDGLAREQAAVIATAHTMTDQAETLLLRLARGSGAHGMAGIAPRRGVYARPFLCLTRAGTEAYCTALGQSYVQDATNSDLRYARNRVRHTVLPELQKINPGAVRAMSRLADQMREVDAWLDAQAQTSLDTARRPDGYCLQTLREAPSPVLDAALHSLLAAYGTAEQRHVALVRALVQQGQGTVQLAPRLSVRAHKGRLTFLCPAPQPQPTPTPAAPRPAAPGRYCLPGGYRLELQLWDAQKYEKFIKNAPNSKKGLNCCADYDKIIGYLLLRTRQPGDRFCPAGRGGHKTLKKLYNERAVPLTERPLLPLLAVGNEVVWLWGVGFAQGLAPDKGTQRLLTVTACRGPQDPGACKEEDVNGIDV